MHRRWFGSTLLGSTLLALAIVGFGACGGSEGGDLEVTDINPRAGATSGEQAVKILGNNFRQDIGYTVYFGTKRSERATIMDEHTLVVATPMMDDPGPVDVRIAADNGPAYRIANGFTFEEQGGNVMEQVGEGATTGHGAERF